MIEKRDLEFCFKGNRTYVQGPDIFDTVMAYLSIRFSSMVNVKYTAYNMLHKNATLVLTNKVIKKNYSTINSLISFVADDLKYYAVISENHNDIICRKEYFEDIVNDNAIIHGEEIIFHNILPDSYTEIAVSMNKLFLKRTIDVEGKWIVTKFDYFDFASIKNIQGKEIKLELKQNLNNTLTKSKMYLDNQEVGHLYFSLIQKES